MVVNCQWVLGIRCGFSAKASNALNCRASFPGLSSHLLMPSSKSDPAILFLLHASPVLLTQGSPLQGPCSLASLTTALRSVLVPHLNGGAFRAADGYSASGWPDWGTHG